MYGVVKIGGSQYKVNAGDSLDVEKLEGEAGAQLVFNEVLFIGGDKTLVGAPTVSGAKVTAEVVKQARSRKIDIMRRKNGKWAKRRGHRQEFTAIVITSIEDGQGHKALAEKKEKKGE